MRTQLDVGVPHRSNQRQTARPKGAALGKMLFRAAMVVYLSTLPLVLLGHQDLLLQIERMNASIATGPASAEMYLKRGDLYRRHQDLDKAAMDYATARQVDPNHPLLDFYDGRLLLESGDAVSAEAHLARHLSANAQHAKAWVLRGQANVHLEQPAQAANCFARAIASSASPSPELYRLQILSILAVGESQWTSAAEIAAAGVERFGVEVTVLGLAVDIALATGMPETANSYLTRLPPALKSLPQWSGRLEALECFANQTGVSERECRSWARQRLHEQVSDFMHN